MSQNAAQLHFQSVALTFTFLKYFSENSIPIKHESAQGCRSTLTRGPEPRFPRSRAEHRPRARGTRHVVPRLSTAGETHGPRPLVPSPHQQPR